MADNDNARKPNIVVILSDDQGAWALGCAGNSEIRTPNLDRLAETGMRFENFFCTSPVCSPARASLLTGQIPSKHGVHDWIRSGNVDKENLGQDLRENGIFRDEQQPIQYIEDLTTYTEILADHGYRCGLSGKWHLGDSVQPQKGFTHWFTIARGGCDYFHPDVVQNGEVKMESRYITDLITDDACAFLDQHGIEETPFYLSVHYTAPHSPWGRDHHPADIYDAYEDCPFESVPDEPKHPWQIPSAPRGEGAERKRLLQGYYAAVTAMDQGIGDILNKLEELGIREDTLIFFTSDNGMNMGHHGIWGKGNGTFPLNMYDTSVKVPAIISWPGHTPGGKVCHELLSHYDVMPTLLDLLGFTNPDSAQAPGNSFASLLEGKTLGSRESVVVYDEYGPVRMIRTKEWKYIHRYPYGPHELYDLLHDPQEKQNLIDDESKSAIRESLKSQLDHWFVQHSDPRVDGTREGVTGFGQLGLAGTKGNGKLTYKMK